MADGDVHCLPDSVVRDVVSERGGVSVEESENQTSAETDTHVPVNCTSSPAMAVVSICCITSIPDYIVCFLLHFFTFVLF